MLICDFIGNIKIENQPIIEAVKRNPDQKLRLTTILQRANFKNENGRVYPKYILEREAKAYNENFVKERRAYGELDHPDSPIVQLKNASHIVTEMHWEGDELVGTIEILSTPSGNIAKALILDNLKLGISSRGEGSLRYDAERKCHIVNDDFSLRSFDLVSNPSTQGAFLNPSIQESIGSKKLYELKKKKRLSEIDQIIYEILSSSL